MTGRFSCAKPRDFTMSALDDAEHPPCRPLPAAIRSRQAKRDRRSAPRSPGPTRRASSPPPASSDAAAGDRAAGDRLRRPLERRQVDRDQRPDAAEAPRLRVEDAGPHAAHQPVRAGPEARGRHAFADLPGYGYAAVERNAKLRWQEVMADYLAVRRSLSATSCCCRLAARPHRHRPQAARLRRAAASRNGSVKLLALLTKVDKLNPRETAARCRPRATCSARSSREQSDVSLTRSRRSAEPASTTPRGCSTGGRTGGAA